MFAYCLNSPTNGFDDKGYQFNGLGGGPYSREYAFEQAIVVGGGGGLCLLAASAIADGVVGVATQITDFIFSTIRSGYEWLTSEIRNKSVNDDLGSIASSYGNYRCVDAAKEMEEYLKSKGERFSIITIQFSGNGYIWSDIKGKTISQNGFHTGILYKGIVFCNVHPTGLPQASWVSDFHGLGNKNVAIIPVC